MLELQNISKSFPGSKALTNVSLAFYNGAVHALCGENGAGKSTLMNIVSGNIQPDSGKIRIDGAERRLDNVAHAKLNGIAIVYQERSLVDSLTVAENIFPTQPKNKIGLISYSTLYRQTQRLLDDLQLKHISPKTKLGQLSSADQQMIEIAKALATSPRLLILDEPTAALSNEDTNTLFGIIRKLRSSGTAIIYITHRMREVREIADTVSVLRDGVLQGTYPAASVSISDIVARMVGRDLSAMHFISHRTAQELLRVDGLTGPGFQNVSFAVNRGEILGFAGLTGSGRTALALSLFGDRKVSSGTVSRASKTIRFDDPSQAIRNGFAYIPDDRKSLGLFLEQSIADNIVSAKLTTTRFDVQANERAGTKYISALGIKTSGPRQTIRNLSGGNQQKVILAKWLNVSPEVLIINEPTQGVDVAAKQEIYHELRKLTAEGKSIILISSELPELLLLSDRIAVMTHGRLTAILDQAEATEENITALASDLD